MPLLSPIVYSARFRHMAAHAITLAASLSLMAPLSYAAETPAVKVPAAAGAVGTPAAAPSAPRVLTLEESIRIAMENNRAIQSAVNLVDKAREHVGEVASSGRLRANFGGNLTRVDKVSTISLPSADGASEVSTGNLYNRTMNLNLTQPIDISGAIRNSRNIAEIGATQALLDLERTREQTELDAKAGYYQVLRAQAALAVAQANVTSLEEHLRQAQQFQKAGIVAQFDVLRAETQVANARQGVIAARNGVDLAKAALNNTMGIDVTTPFEVRSAGKITPIQPNYQQSVKLAYDQRPEVQQARWGVEMASRGISLARSAGLPTLAVGATASYNMDTSLFSARTSQWNANAILSFPLLDGGLTRSLVKQAHADQEVALVAEEQVRDGIALEVQQAILSMRDAAERMDAADKNLAQAKEALRLANVRYQAGVSTSLEVTDAQSVLTQAETNAVNARYDYMNALARYERAIGPAPQK